MRQLARRTQRHPVAAAALVSGAAAALIVTLAAARSPAGASDASGTHVGAVKLRSAGVMTFGSDGTLFLADPLGAVVYAIDVADPLRDTTTSGVRIDDVDGKIAAALGTTRDQIRVHDMVAHPVSQALYFSITRGRGESAIPLVVRVTKVEETVTAIPLESIRHSRADLADAPKPDAKTPWGAPQLSLSITDIGLVDGELYVAGLSNEQFASTLRRLPYPFTPGTRAATTVEIYHTSHDRYETASPIESFVPVTLNGKPSLLAGYGCSPIATFSRSELAAAKHLRGKTVAEIGGGSRPFDMVTYRNSKGKDYVLIANSARTLTRFDIGELASAPGMTKPVTQANEPGGVGYLPIAAFGILQLDSYNANNLVILQRDADDGSLRVGSLQMRWL